MHGFHNNLHIVLYRQGFEGYSNYVSTCIFRKGGFRSSFVALLIIWCRFFFVFVLFEMRTHFFVHFDYYVLIGKKKKWIKSWITYVVRTVIAMHVFVFANAFCKNFGELHQNFLRTLYHFRRLLIVQMSTLEWKKSLKIMQ